MGDRLTEKTVLLNELGDPEKVAKKLVMNLQQFLDSDEPGDSSATASVVDEPCFELADSDEFDAAIPKRKDKIQLILDYLKDKQAETVCFSVYMKEQRCFYMDSLRKLRKHLAEELDLAQRRMSGLK